MSVDQRIVCTKCGKDKRETEFFMLKTGERDNMCKDCLTLYIDNKDPSTFMWILEKFDVPYIEDVWIQTYNKQYAKDPSKMGPKSVIGHYLRAMKMNQYNHYSFKDTDKINYEKAAQKNQVAGAGQPSEEELKAKLESGEISEAEYKTMVAVPQQKFINSYMDGATINEDEIMESLSKEDRQYLLNKWGGYYKPSEWLSLEESYAKYANEYELNADREDILRKICKTSLKMDQALDAMDIKTYKDLNSVFDGLRKSGKFTEAQNKEEVTREIDSIGELVAFVEKESGIIPTVKEEEYPQDKVDFLMKDLQNYVNNLIKNELGLGDLIESYIEKADKQKVQTVEEIMLDSFNDAEDDSLTLEDVEEFQEFQAEEVVREAQKIQEQFQEFGG